jgi:predicted DNA binding CopG/RHH family protein
MKKLKLNPLERKINQDFVNNNLVSVVDFKKEKETLVKTAKTDLKKSKNINIRISEPTLLRLKSRAAENGIPYQTLVSAVLHQFANKKLKLSI